MRIIDWKTLKEMQPYSRQHVARLGKEGRFPRRVRLSPNRAGWVYDEVVAWLESFINSRDQNTSHRSRRPTCPSSAS